MGRLSSHLELTEPDQLRSVIPGVSLNAMPAKAGAVGISVATVEFDDLLFHTGRCSPMLATATVLPAGRVFLQLPFEGLESFILNGQPLQSGAVGLYGEGADFVRASRQQTRHVAVGFPVGMVEEGLGLGSNSPLLRSGGRGVMRARRSAWERMARLGRAAFDASARSPDAFATEEAGRSLRDGVWDAARELIDSARDVPEASAGPLTAKYRRIAQMADEYLHANVARPIYTHDLCAALGVSATGLAEAYRVTFGTTPHRYLKMRRLAMVRKGLRAAAMSGRATLVKTIALSHGFWHLGQFAHDYRAMYGETPSETLLHSRP